MIIAQNTETMPETPETKPETVHIKTKINNISNININTLQCSVMVCDFTVNKIA